MKKLIITMLGLAMAVPAFAQFQNRRGQLEKQRFPIVLDGAHYRGRNQRIKLKQLLNQNYPEMRPLIRNGLMQIEKVRLIAKSKRGGGQAALMVAGSEQDRTTLARGNGPFRQNGRHSYGRPYVLHNYSGGQQGAWQIRLDGNIKVHKVVIVATVAKRFKKRRLEIDMGSQHFRGQNRIPLKRLIKQNYPRVARQLRNGKVKLMRVRVVGKSKRGRGTATLMVAGSQQGSATLQRRGRHFGDHPRTYPGPVVLENYDKSSTHGAWQVHLRGNIKILKLVIVVKVQEGKDSFGRGFGHRF